MSSYHEKKGHLKWKNLNGKAQTESLSCKDEIENINEMKNKTETSNMKLKMRNGEA